MDLPLLKYEMDLWNDGITHVAGVDEAGRGPLAGPIVIATVILDKEHLHQIDSKKSSGLLETYALINDSKKVSVKRRELLFDFIMSNAISHSIEEIPHDKIDEWGISKSNQIGFFNSVQKLTPRAEHILTDYIGIKAIAESRQTNIKRGDSESISVAAASILAKVHRDRIMVEYHDKYPQYGFDKHKGYGTRFHMDQLQKLGPCDIHRRSFNPVKSFFPKPKFLDFGT